MIFFSTVYKLYYFRNYTVNLMRYRTCNKFIICDKFPAPTGQYESNVEETVNAKTFISHYTAKLFSDLKIIRSLEDLGRFLMRISLSVEFSYIYFPPEPGCCLSPLEPSRYSIRKKIVVHIKILKFHIQATISHA